MYEKTLINATLKRMIETNENVEATDLYSEQESPEQRTVDVEIVSQEEPKQIAQSTTNQPKPFKI